MENKILRLLGVTMCGGESLRMGTDKGLMVKNGTTWAQTAYNKLTALNIPVVVSINATQIKGYGALFNAADLITDSLPLKGPLNGLSSVHRHHPEKDLLILACDMTDIQQTALQHLISTYLNQPGHDFYAYHNSSFFEPLCAIYTSAALAALTEIFNSGQLNGFSLQQILNKGNTKSLPITDMNNFKNSNSRD